MIPERNLKAWKTRENKNKKVSIQCKKCGSWVNDIENHMLKNHTSKASIFPRVRSVFEDG